LKKFIQNEVLQKRRRKSFQRNIEFLFLFSVQIEQFKLAQSMIQG